MEIKIALSFSIILFDITNMLYHGRIHIEDVQVSKNRYMVLSRLIYCYVKLITFIVYAVHEIPYYSIRHSFRICILKTAKYTRIKLSNQLNL